MALIVDGSRGIYVPQTFAERYGAEAVQRANVKQEDIDILLQGPEHDWYWEAWDEVLNNYRFGNFVLVSQDGDLFEEDCTIGQEDFQEDF